MAKFEPQLKRSRFSAVGFTPARMLSLGNEFVSVATKRILGGKDIYDNPGPPLAAGYARWKGLAYPPGMRNWKRTGRLLRTMKIISYSPSRVSIGFPDPVIDKRIQFLQKKGRMWGVSPADKIAIHRFITEHAREIVKVA